MTKTQYPPVDDAAIDKAVSILSEGGLVAIPTETVYGLAADADNKDAVLATFAVKNRPTNHPLIVHVAGPEALDAWAVNIPSEARLLVKTFWPGPLTLVLKNRRVAATLSPETRIPLPYAAPRTRGLANF